MNLWLSGLIATVFAGALGYMGLGGESARAGETSQLLTQRARAAFEGGRGEEARGLLEQAVTSDPSDGRAFAWLGRVHEEGEREDLAGKYYDRALLLDPDDEDALEWGGGLDVVAGNLERARERADRLRELCGECVGWRELEERLLEKERESSSQ